MPSTCPPITSISAGPAPLYGTSETFMPADAANSAATRCEVEPTPALLIKSLPGFFLPISTSSRTSLAGWSLRTISTIGVSGKRNTGAKSLTGS
ncbi:hypothetical protein D3C72_2203970 [compost metagenome]